MHAGMLGNMTPNRRLFHLSLQILANCHQVGEYEILRSDSERLSENARQAGVDATLEIWDGMWHVWHVFAGLMPESQRAIERIGSFIHTRMNIE